MSSTKHVEYKESFAVVSTMKMPRAVVTAPPFGGTFAETFYSMVSVGDFLYALCFPLGQVYKISIDAFETPTILTLTNPILATGGITSDGTYLYVCGTSRATIRPVVVKIDISTFSEVDILTLPPGANSGVFDFAINGTNLYVTTDTFPTSSSCILYRISLITFTVTGSLVPTTVFVQTYMLNNLHTTTTCDYLFISMSATYVKIDLALFLEVAVLPLRIISAVIIGNTLFGCDYSNKIYVIDMPTFLVIKVSFFPIYWFMQHDTETENSYILFYESNMSLRRYHLTDLLTIDSLPYEQVLLPVHGSPQTLSINGDFMFVSLIDFGAFADTDKFNYIVKVAIREMVIGTEVDSSTTTTAVDVSSTRIRTVRHVTAIAPTVISVG